MAWTAPRTWIVGEIVTAAQLNAHVRDNLNAIGPHVRVRKTATESVTSSITLQNDDELLFAIGANETWLVQVCVGIGAPTGGDIKFAWSAPAGATGRHGGYLPGLTVTGVEGSARFESSGTLTNAISGGGAGGGTPLSGMLFASIVNAGTAGTVNLQWAQDTASGTTDLLVGSLLIAHRVG